MALLVGGLGLFWWLRGPSSSEPDAGADDEVATVELPTRSIDNIISARYG